MGMGVFGGKSAFFLKYQPKCDLKLLGTVAFSPGTLTFAARLSKGSNGE
jgi:hypothetical protein